MVNTCTCSHVYQDRVNCCSICGLFGVFVFPDSLLIRTGISATHCPVSKWQLTDHCFFWSWTLTWALISYHQRMPSLTFSWSALYALLRQEYFTYMIWLTVSLVRRDRHSTLDSLDHQQVAEIPSYIRLYRAGDELSTTALVGGFGLIVLCVQCAHYLGLDRIDLIILVGWWFTPYFKNITVKLSRSELWWV